MQKGPTKIQILKSKTLANRSCNRNEVFVNGFSADQKRELVRDLRTKYRGVRITRDARGEYIVYEDETRNIRSTYLSPVNLVSRTKENKQPQLERKSQSSSANMVVKVSRTFDVRGSARALYFSPPHKTPISRIQKSNSNSINEQTDASQLKTSNNEKHNPLRLTFDDVVNKPSQIARDPMLSNHKDIKLKPSEGSEQTQSNEEKELKEEEKELNRFIDNLLSASYGDFDTIFEKEIIRLNQERIATLMIERFKRRKQELDEIAKSNQLSTDQFLERYLYYDPKPQIPQPQVQQPQAQDAQAQTAQGQQDKTSQPITENSKAKFQRDAGIIARQIFFKDRLSESLFQEYRKKSQTSLSVSQQDLVNQSAQSASQDRSQKSATSQSNISNISRNISRDYVRSSPQNRLISTFLDKSKERFTESFQRIYNQSISQSQSSSQLLLGQVLPDANSSDAINAGAGSSSENQARRKSRSRSPGRASIKVQPHPFAPDVSRSLTPPPRPSAVSALDLEGIGKKGALDLSSVAPEPGIGNGSGRGGNVYTPRNIKSAPTTARGPGLHLPAISTNRSAPGQLENKESPRQFQDADEDPDDQNLTDFIQNFILETSFQDGVEESQNHSQDQLDDSLDQSLAELPDQSQAKSPKNSISRELEKITQARIVGLMKQKFSEFKANYPSQNTQNSPQRINPDLYRKFLFETDENGNDLQSPRPAKSNAKTVSVIFKALAICLVEAENNPNEIVKSPQSTESSPPSPPSPLSKDGSIISSEIDYGGNVMTEILKILNDQRQSNLGSESFEQYHQEADQSILDQKNYVNQDQEGKIINRENFTQLLERLNGIVSPEDEREVVSDALVAGAELFEVNAELGFPPSNPKNLNPNLNKVLLEASLVVLELRRQEPEETLWYNMKAISPPPSPTQDPQNLSVSNEAGGKNNKTPPPSPKQNQNSADNKPDSPGMDKAIKARIVSSLIGGGLFPNAQDVSKLPDSLAGLRIIQPLEPHRKARFEKVGSQNTSPDQTVERHPAKIINVLPPPAPLPLIGGQQQPLTPVTTTALFIHPRQTADSPQNLSSSPAKEVLELGPTASPALTATTDLQSPRSGQSASPQTASPQTASPQTASHQTASPPISPALAGASAGESGGASVASAGALVASADGSASDSETASPPISPASIVSAGASADAPQTASHPSSPALAGGSADGSASDSKIVSRSSSLASSASADESAVASVALADAPADGSASDSKIVSPPSSPVSVASAVGSAYGSAGWAVEEVQAVQLPFKYSIISQDHQDDVNDQPNPKKDYDFFIQKSQDYEGKNTENKKTKIAISKTKFQNNDDQDPLPMTPQIKEQKTKELVKKAIIEAIEETKEKYSSKQNSSSQEDEIYYEYLEIAIAVQGVKNKADQFKKALIDKGIAESEIENHFNKAQLLSENFQKIAKENFGIFTGRIGEVQSRAVGMRTKRIPIDLLNEVKREKLPPSNSPSEPNSPLASSSRSMSPH